MTPQELKFALALAVDPELAADIAEIEPTVADEWRKRPDILLAMATAPKTQLIDPSEPLTRRQQVFARLMAQGGTTNTEAAELAGYSHPMQMAHTLLQNPVILARIKALQRVTDTVVMQQTGIDLARVVAEISKLAFFDPRMLFDHKGEPLPIADLDDDTAACIAGLDVEQIYESGGRGMPRQNVGRVLKYKIANKLDALKDLAKQVGAYELDNRQKTSELTEFLQQIATRNPGRMALQPTDD